MTRAPIFYVPAVFGIPIIFGFITFFAPLVLFGHDVPLEDISFLGNGWHFIMLGMTHIFTGLDHILFLVAMMLTVLALREVLHLTITFTIAHSITLILAGTFFWSVSSSIVEPIIAFSIAYVAAGTVLLTSEKLKMETLRNTRIKILAVFIFGLIHGLGFAGLLREIQIPSDMFLSSLVFFNVGIEIGQLVLVSAIVPALFLIRQTKWSLGLVRLAAILLTITGLFWGIERIIAA